MQNIDLSKYSPDNQKKLIAIMNDPDVKKLCQNVRYGKTNGETFEDIVADCTRLLTIDTSNIKSDREMNHFDWTADEIKENLFDFYSYVDDMTPKQGELLSKVEFNYNNYFTLKKAKPGKYFRSGCGVDHGQRFIAVNHEGRFGDIGTTIHEFCHSLSKNFEDIRPMKDKRMSEICTVMTDVFVREFLADKYPYLEERAKNYYITSQLDNIAKAKETLFDADIIKFGLGEITFDELEKNYVKLFGNDLYLFNDRLDKIYNKKYLPDIQGKVGYIPLYEHRYLIPQAIAQIMLDRYKKDPKKALKQFKDILEKDADITLEDAMKELSIKNKEKLLDDYINNFDDRIKQHTTELIV